MQLFAIVFLIYIEGIRYPNISQSATHHLYPQIRLEMNSGHQTLFKEWLAEACAGLRPTKPNLDGTQHPIERHYGPKMGNVLDQLMIAGPLTDMPDPVTNVLPHLSTTFEEIHSRKLKYDLVTIRIFLPHMSVQDHDCGFRGFQASQSVYYSHTGSIRFDCIIELDPTKIDYDERTGVITDLQRSLIDRTVELKKRLKDQLLTESEYKQEFECMLKGCPMQCESGICYPGKFMTPNQIDPKDMLHMFKITPHKTVLGPCGKQVCIQLVFRELEFLHSESKTEGAANESGSNNGSKWVKKLQSMQSGDGVKKSGGF